MIQGMMVGASRRILESSAPEKQFEILRQELIFVACAYLDACSTRGLAQDAGARRQPTIRGHANPSSQSKVNGVPQFG
jgi:hypothetical protein